MTRSSNTVLILLGLLCAGCAGNRAFHTFAVDQGEVRSPVRFSVQGRGVMVDALLVALHKGCPGIVLLAEKGDFLITILDRSSRYLGISCREVRSRRLFYSRSWILTDRSFSALKAIFVEYTRGLKEMLDKPRKQRGVK